MKLNTNLMALQTSAAMGRINNNLAKSSAKISSGVRIRSAADGGAASAIVTKMNLRLSNVAKATNNAADAISLIQTAAGALNEIVNMVQRARELSIQAASDTLTQSDRDKLQMEIDSYKEEITASARRAEHNGIQILSGEAGDIIRAIQNNDENCIGINKVSDTVNPGKYCFNISVSASGGFGVTLEDGFPNTATADVDGNILTVTDVDDRKIILDLSHCKPGDAELVIEDKNLVFQVGASKGMETKIKIPKVSTETLELNNLSVCSCQEADTAILQCDKALEDLNRINARLGAYMNRFGYTITNLETTEFNLESSLSRIRDTDISKEMIEYSKAQVLAQADISLLAQANQRPQQILALIQ